MARTQALWIPIPRDNDWHGCWGEDAEGGLQGKALERWQRCVQTPGSEAELCNSACMCYKAKLPSWWLVLRFCWLNLPPGIRYERDSPSCGAVPSETQKNCISEKSWFSPSSSAWGNNTSCVPQAGRSVCHGLWRPLSSHPQRCWPSRTFGVAIWPGDSAVFSTGCRWECQSLLSLVSPVSLLPCQGHLKDFWKKHDMVEGWWCGHLHCRPTSLYKWIPSM